MKIFMYFVVLLFAGVEINGLFLPSIDVGRPRTSTRGVSWYSRVRRLPRPAHKIIDPAEDCFLVTSEEGEIFFKAPSDEPVVCGIYMIAEPDERIQLTFNYLDVPCENGGLVAWVDGWELNGQVWPADSWDESRVVESCDRRPRQKLISSQNAALVQYRVPTRGKGFAITIRHLRNPKPCNIMLFGAEGVYTVRNHGAAGNCSVIAVGPSSVRILDLDVGRTTKRTASFELETGTIHNCLKRGMADYVDIGGASGLDNTKMEVLDSVCGLNSNEGHKSALIACEDTVVRLVSSGRYFNAATVAFAPLDPDALDQADLICGFNDI